MAIRFTGECGLRRVKNVTTSVVHFCHCHAKRKNRRIRRVKYWEIIADNLSKAGWSKGYVSAVDSQG
jgi:hypothetical protein